MYENELNQRNSELNMKPGFEVLYHAANIDISYSDTEQVLYCDWIGVQDEAGLKRAGEMILTLLAAKKCSKVLNDNTRVIGPWYHSVNWTASTWFPDMIEAGLRHFAWVCSKDIFAQLSAKRAIPEGNVIKAFQTYDEAFEWLTKIK
jgi:hypothetical protein